MRARGGKRGGFVLLEVLLSLLILGIAVAAFMRSFTQSLAAARRMEAQTQAGFLAEQLMNQMEITPPADGTTEGNFGEQFKNFTYTVTMDFDEPNYGKLDGDDQIEQFYALRVVDLVINFDDKVHKPFEALRLHTAVMGFEKFTYSSKQSYANY